MTRIYLAVWCVLVVLLAITVGLSYLPLGALGTFLSFAIALLKAILVAAFYMHLRESGAHVRFFATGACFWLFTLYLFTLVDGLSRLLEAS